MRKLIRFSKTLGVMAGAAATIAVSTTPAAADSNRDGALKDVSVSARCTAAPGQGQGKPNAQITATTIRNVRMQLVAFLGDGKSALADNLGYRDYVSGTIVTVTLDPAKYPLKTGEIINLALVGVPFDAKGSVAVYGEGWVTGAAC